MRVLITIFLFQVVIVFGQTDEGLAIISQSRTNVLLWNIENHVEFRGSQDFDSTWLYSENCDFKGTNVYSGYLIPRILDGHCRVTVMGLIGTDTIIDASFIFHIIRLPTPEIRLGSNFNLLEDLNNLQDSSLFFFRFLKVTYPHWLQTLLNNHCLRHMKVIHWEIKVGNELYIGKNAILTEELISEIIKSKIGTPILFEKFIVLMPDGREIKIESNSEYLKKTSSGVSLPKYKPTIIEN
ncbi:hypothetical protein [Crocinitomix catalasitica]|uniref:hypothetical protein n=1 Tax=Crocinitomix catalasitica TaxID=184607 RepID=UPI000480DE7F|nr:hypothetical protein [Crocinitomix catalasitica]